MIASCSYGQGATPTGSSSVSSNHARRRGMASDSWPARFRCFTRSTLSTHTAPICGSLAGNYAVSIRALRRMSSNVPGLRTGPITSLSRFRSLRTNLFGSQAPPLSGRLGRRPPVAAEAGGPICYAVGSRRRPIRSTCQADYKHRPSPPLKAASSALPCVSSHQGANEGAAPPNIDARIIVQRPPSGEVEVGPSFCFRGWGCSSYLDCVVPSQAFSVHAPSTRELNA